MREKVSSGGPAYAPSFCSIEELCRINQQQQQRAAEDRRLAPERDRHDRPAAERRAAAEAVLRDHQGWPFP